MSRDILRPTLPAQQLRKFPGTRHNTGRRKSPKFLYSFSYLPTCIKYWSTCIQMLRVFWAQKRKTLRNLRRHAGTIFIRMVGSDINLIKQVSVTVKDLTEELHVEIVLWILLIQSAANSHLGSTWQSIPEKWRSEGVVWGHEQGVMLQK